MTERDLQVTGRRVHVRTDGAPDRPAVVLVHGFSSSLHSFDRLVPLLAEDAWVVRTDLLGHGRSGGPAADSDVQGAALAAVLAELDVRACTLVGHSFGADVVIDAAERLAGSGVVAHLVVLAQAPDLTQATFPPGAGLLAAPVLGAALHRVATRPAVQRAGRVAFAPGFRPTAAEQGRSFADQRAMDAGMYRVVLVDRRRRMLARPLDARLADLDVPATVVLGGRDRFYGARSAARYAAAGARVEVLPDAGHSVATEDPAAVAALLTSLRA